MGRYGEYLRIPGESGESQISPADADARLTREKNGLVVAHDPQTAVDPDTHPVRDFETADAPTDHGQLLPTLEAVAGQAGGVPGATADLGHRSEGDMVACPGRGILPHVICGDGQDAYDLEVPYAEADDPDASSTAPDDLSACTHAGVVPDAYAHAIEGTRVVEARRKVVDEPDRRDPREYGTRAETGARAREGYFVRDPGDNLVICPACERPGQKSARKTGKIRHTDKTARGRCPSGSRCLTGKQDREGLDFPEDETVRPCRPWHEAAGTEPDSCGVTRGRYHFDKVKVVRFRLRPQIDKTTPGTRLSDYPYLQDIPSFTQRMWPTRACACKGRDNDVTSPTRSCQP